MKFFIVYTSKNKNKKKFNFSIVLHILTGYLNPLTYQ